MNCYTNCKLKVVEDPEKWILQIMSFRTKLTKHHGMTISYEDMMMS